MIKKLLIFLILLNCYMLQSIEQFQMIPQIKVSQPDVIKISPSGERYVSLIFDHIYLWNNTGRLERVIKLQNRLEGPGGKKQIFFSEDSKYLLLLVYGLETEITLLECATGKQKVIAKGEYVYVQFSGNNIIALQEMDINASFPEVINYSDFDKMINKSNKKDKKMLQYSYKKNIDGNYETRGFLNVDEAEQLDDYFEKIDRTVDYYNYFCLRVEMFNINGERLHDIGEIKINDTSYDNSFFVTNKKQKLILWSKSSIKSYIKIIDFNEGIIAEFESNNDLKDIIPHSNNKQLFLVFPDSNFIQVCNYEGIILKEFKNISQGMVDYEKNIKAIQYHQTDKNNSKGKTYKIIINDESGKKIGETKYVDAAFGIFAVSEDYKTLVAFLENTLKIFNLKTGDYINILYKDQQWITYTDDGYWDASPNGGTLLKMIKGYEAYSIDQFAPKFNRPDIILKRLGIKDDEVINHYYNQYLKRLRRMGINKKELENIVDLKTPSVEILSSEQNDKFLKIKFKGEDAHNKIIAYNIFVNDVPVYNTYKKNIDDSINSFTETIELTSGLNKIEVSCTNDKGIESFRAVTNKNYNKIVKGDLYFIGFGVSDYKNPDIADLQYAHQDVIDLKNMFDGLKGYYNNIYTKAFTNQMVTLQSIIDAKQLLKNAKVDDTFILFIAGHGLHDTDNDSSYYYLTYDSDFNDLKKTAADFNLIEDLLQDIKPREKLFLMDTCESGEIDEELYIKRVVDEGSRGLIARSIRRSVSKENSKHFRKYLYERDRYIYNDLIRRSGAIIFSSSKGGEFSFEHDKLKNGLFTEELINAFTTGNADKNKDNIISIIELKNYVSESVEKLSTSLQHPTVDRDNIYLKINFPKIKK